MKADDRLAALRVLHESLYSAFDAWMYEHSRDADDPKLREGMAAVVGDFATKHAFPICRGETSE